ncbi:uncharacterized protein LOC125041906 [Penaeus chinensis]|uniref:uncharacterized protein LOC125041906 n=1 Tax=Penaeus chinensis TaxID=139456 RepID=UPI001FB83CB3|nr:uncharacterized protein LOC125041906 [Penaeus chinensis]
MLRIAVVLCVVASSMGFMMPEAMLKKYAYMKIMKSCLGEEKVMSWMFEMKKAMAECGGEYDEYLEELRLRPNYIPVYVNAPFMSHFPQPPSQGRTKRFVDFEAVDIEGMKESMQSKINNITCALQKLEYINEEGAVNYDLFKEEIEDLNVNNMLKADLLEAVDMCESFSSCMPTEQSKHPLMQQLGSAISFMKCCSMKKLMMCMKNDFRTYAAQMGYKGPLDEAMEQVPSNLEELFDNLM